ncbi:hypothetical protein [Pseudohoeflea coraliihabitans]|uniref:Uncharacterized protein n=1 Tax=Pseudohoeflea coraliihabitans TaxID=2860393 RepID=A0ABS6WPF6_9HYPH|nr:hypothetical protein [Pseudohoeflea sp. DP4N28-3]MBW3097518.1 hypothetical protein [Pseudohoeflea sp. DP4N28-3]
MTGMETAIRNALAKVERPDEQARLRIYQSARVALQRGLERKGGVDPEHAAAQQARLNDLIARIEAEYAPPVPTAGPVQGPEASLDASLDESPVASPVASPVSSPVVNPDARAPSGPRAEPTPDIAPVSRPAAAPVGPEISPQRREPKFSAPSPRLDAPERAARTAPAADPVLDDGLTLPPQDRRGTAPGAKSGKPGKPGKRSGAPDARHRRRRSGRHLAATLFSGLVLMSFLGIGFWWVVQSGALQSALERDTSVPNPPPQVSVEDYDGEGPRPLNPAAGFSRAWTPFYTPGASGDRNAIRMGENVTVRLLEPGETDAAAGEEGSVLEIISSDSGEAGEVRLPIARSVLEQLAGRRATLALSVHAIDAEGTQFYVKCDFGSLGGCGRRRFDAGNELTDALLEVDFRQKLAPAEGGEIILNSDVSGAGNGLYLYAIRSRPAR